MSKRFQIQIWFLSLITLSLLLLAIQQRVEAQTKSENLSEVHRGLAAGTSSAAPANVTGNTPIPASGGASTAATISEPVIINGIATKEVSGVVRLIRGSPETEVFFLDLKDSLIIPKDSQHNKLFDLCEQSRKKGTAVKLLIDPKARRILGHPKPPESIDSEGSY